MADVDGPGSTTGHVSLRSRRGCVICRTKKVKCDEQRSVCGRCRRLRLKCDWTSPTTAKERKRILAEHAATKKILPRSHQTFQPPDESSRVEGSSDVDRLSHPDIDNTSSWCPPNSISHVSTDGCGTFPDELWSLDLGANEHLYPPSLDSVSFASISPDSSTLHPNSHSPTAARWPLELSRLLDIPSPQLSIQKIALASPFQVTKREYRALDHFQTQFSISRSSKCPLWSTHALMLRLGWQQPMIMHLVIATSLTDLSLRFHENSALYHYAIPHFQAGLHLLMEAIQPGYERDQTILLPAFFFVYLYLAMRPDTPGQGMSQLSNLVLNHVQQRNLTGRSSGDYQVHTSTPSNQKAFIFRMLIWLFYEDTAGGFLGQGGVLARYLISEPQHLEQMYEQSTTGLEAGWGLQYPDNEAVDDVENGTVLRTLFDLMSVFQHINELCDCFTSDKSELIKRKLDALEETSRPLFRLTKIRGNYHSRVLLNTDWVVVLFYSLRVYHFRSTLSGLDNTPTPADVQSALNALLSIAQRRYASDKQDMFTRLQLPLFMAGIETSDAIYREWILSKLWFGRYRYGLEQVLQLQEQTGIKVSMSVIRDVLNGGGELTTAISDSEPGTLSI